MSHPLVGKASSSRLLAFFAVLSLGTVLAGIAICAASDVPLSVGLRNLAAWAVGAVAALAIAAKARRGALPVFLWLLPVGLLLSFLSPDLQGVHRWLSLGPLNLNIAMLLAPAGVVAFAARMEVHPPSSWIALLAALALTVAQPDASQAAALALVALLAAWFLYARPLSRLLLAAVAVAGAVFAWLRPDPLAPVPEVEGVVGLAFAQSLALGVLALALLLLTSAAPMTAAGSPRARLPALALGLLMLASSAAPFFGAFPVPFLGIGPGPIVGAWLGVGLLASLLKDQAAEVIAA